MLFRIFASIGQAPVGDLGLQALNRSYARDGVYFHPWSSEVMMQTVPIEDLRLEPAQVPAHKCQHQ